MYQNNAYLSINMRILCSLYNDIDKRVDIAQTSITLDVYEHLIPNMQSDIADFIDKLITQYKGSHESKTPSNGDVKVNETGLK